MVCVWPLVAWPSPEHPVRSFSLSLKPSEAPELDEDEGFSDWSQKPEQRRQHWGAGETSSCGEPPGGESSEGQQEEDRQVGVDVWRRGRQAGFSPSPQPVPENRPPAPQNALELGAGGREEES